ncbi:hypothetical protein EV421DRAFT_1908007 [Armillaria borealis]|uniref:Heterokaryon incompatibility domain-containing protein n=1 Tax=Armillaria borealis TaxID=47425 RepID=A0AA39J588_9AGAR|nr:hypothetical protein EV421DRAFT_1908007 [Armillaria borealis]
MDAESWYDCYRDEILKQSWLRIREDAHRRYENLSEVTISAFEDSAQAELLIKVPLQRVWTGRKPVISSSLADTPCADLGVGGLLEKLNNILGTAYTLDQPWLYFFLHDYAATNRDFGAAYAYLRPRWYIDWTYIRDEIDESERRDRDMRQHVMNGNRILNRWVPPRYLWDLYSNRVVPWAIAGIDLTMIWTVSHAWVAEGERFLIWTMINGLAWPVPLPKGIDLQWIRIELLRKGAEYVWQDVLCLRQAGGTREDLRAEEWKLDVPTIGHVYERADKVLCYFNGLGRPLSGTVDTTSDRSWFRRAWTMQEIQLLRQSLIGGETEEGLNPDTQRAFEKQLSSIQNMDHFSIYAVLSEMQPRVSTNPVDRVAGLSYLLRTESIPTYYAAQSDEGAWSALVDVLGGWVWADLFFQYPKAGHENARWRPSWQQAMSDVLPDGWGWGFVDEGYSHRGYCIEKGLIRGLSEAQHGHDREGELRVEDSNGVQHSFKITAQHQHPIQENVYTLIGNTNNGKLHHWVVGRRNADKFEKVSIFQMPDRAERQRLEGLDVVRQNVKVDLC